MPINSGRGNTLEVVVDSREKPGYEVPFPEVFTWWRGPNVTPILFKVRVVRSMMDFGDYGLTGRLGECVVETKRSLEELARNFFTSDRDRSLAALDRLAAGCKHPMLLVECGLADLTAFRLPNLENRYVMPSPRAVIDQLFRECMQRNVPVWLVGGMRMHGTRRHLGDLILRYLVSHTIGPDLDKLDTEEVLRAQAVQDRWVTKNPSAVVDAAKAGA